jgi:hypothetical protein
MSRQIIRCDYCRRVLSYAAAQRGEWHSIREQSRPDREIAVHVVDCERMSLRQIRIAARLRREAARA